MLLGHQKEKREILEWLTNFKTDLESPSACIITGSTGIGKTMLVKQIINETNYDLVLLTPDDLPSKSETKEFLKQYLHTEDIKFMFQKKKKNTVIMIDEIENIGLSQKTCLMELLQNVYPSKRKGEISFSKKMNIPFFFVGQHSHLKVLQTLLKHSLKYELKPPSFQEQLILVNKTLELEQDEDVVSLLIDHCNNDIRQLMILINELYHYREINNISKKKMKINEMVSWLNNFQVIENEPDLIISTKTLMEDKIDIVDSLTIYDTDRYLIPLMIHENIPILMGENGIDMSVMHKILNTLIDFDQIDSFMYQNQYWQLQNICGLIICGSITVILKEYDLAAKKYYFTRHLNKVSLQTVKRNAINRLQRSINVNSMYALHLTQILYANNLLDVKLSKENEKILLTFNKIPSSGKGRVL